VQHFSENGNATKAGTFTSPLKTWIGLAWCTDWVGISWRLAHVLHMYTVQWIASITWGDMRLWNGTDWKIPLSGWLPQFGSQICSRSIFPVWSQPGFQSVQLNGCNFLMKTAAVFPHQRCLWVACYSKTMFSPLFSVEHVLSLWVKVKYLCEVPERAEWWQ